MTKAPLLVADEMIAGVRAGGDAYVAEQIARFDGVTLAPGAPRLSRDVTTKIATKYPRITRQYLESKGLRAEVVPLGGSVELAAVLSLTSHVIDLVETGETVRVHKLELQDFVAEITPRLIVAKNVYRTRNRQMRELIARIEEAKNELVESIVA